MTIRMFFATWRFPERTVAKAGRIDGASGDPGIDHPEVSAYERTLVDHGEGFVSRCQEQFALNEGELSQRFKISRDKYLAAKKNYDSKVEELKRPVYKPIPMWGYILSLILIVLVELPVNQAALYSLGEGLLFTTILAALLGVVLMIFAHIWGMTARHRGMNLGTVVGVLLTIGVIAGMAYLRVKFFMHPADGDDLLTPALRDTDPRALTALFATMNTLFVFVGMWLSFLAHDEDEHYERIEQDFNAKQTVATTLQSERAKAHARAKSEAVDFIELIHGLINIYRRHNLAARSNHVVPGAWQTHTPESLLAIKSFDFELKDNELGSDPK